MQSKSKKEEQLLDEISRLRKRIAELEKPLKRTEENYQNFENHIEGIHQTTPEGRFIDANQSDMRSPGHESPGEDASHLMEQHLQAILEAVNLPIILVNSDYEYRWVNSCYAGAHDRKPSEFVGRKVPDVWGRQTFDMHLKKDLDTCLAGHAVKREAWVDFPVWGRRYCTIVCSPYVSRSEPYVIVVAYDVTERRKARKAVKNSESRFRSLSEASLEAVVFMEDGIIVDGNEALGHLFGYEDEDLRGRPIIELIAPELRNLSEERVSACVEGAYETLGLRKDGTVFPIEVNARECNYDGKKLRTSAIRDLTDRKRIENELKDYQEQLEKLVEERTAELRESERKYRDIFDDAAVGIYQSTPDGRLLMVNHCFAQIHGFENAEELLRSVTDVAAQLYAEPEHRKDWLNLMDKDGIVRNFELQVRRKDGAMRHLSLNAHAVKDGNGKILWYDGVLQDITEKILTHELVIRQRDLALRLAQAESLEEGLAMILDTAVIVSGMECGGVLLKDSETSRFDLISSVGLTREFQQKIRHTVPGTFFWSYIMEKKSHHIRTSRDLTPVLFGEGFQIISLMPILEKDEVTGCLIMASKVRTDIPDQVRTGLELLAAQSGNSIARMQARERLEAEITTRRQTERALEVERQSLHEANTALKVLLKNGEEARKELEEKFLANVKQLVLPHVEKLKKSALNPVQQMSINFIESSLGDLVSPFVKGIRDLSLTQRQMEVATLIRDGRTTKDIAGILNVSQRAVDIQRFMIRKKLGLNKAKINLQTYLKSLS